MNFPRLEVEEAAEAEAAELGHALKEKADDDHFWVREKGVHFFSKTHNFH